MSDFAHFARARGISVYGVSSHAPTPFRNHWAMKWSDVEDYFSEFFRLKKLYEDQMELYVGMELDFLTIPSLLTESDSPLDSYPLDYRIGSIHYLDPLTNLDGTPLFWNVGGNVLLYASAIRKLYNGDVNRLIRRYIEQLTQLITTTSINVLAHCDIETTIAEKFFGFDPNQKWYLNQLQHIFTLAKQHDVIIEINTKHLLSEGITSPHQRHFNLLKQSGAAIQVNTDAHYPQHVDSGLRETYSLLNDAGITSQRILSKGEWTDVTLQS